MLKVISLGSDLGPKGITVTLYNESNKQVPVGTTVTAEGGTFLLYPDTTWPIRTRGIPSCVSLRNFVALLRYIQNNILLCAFQMGDGKRYRESNGTRGQHGTCRQ